MLALPLHSVLLVLSDHGHEAGGGTGGTSEAVRQLPLYVYRKQVQFDVSIEVLSAFTAADAPSGNTHGATMASVTPTVTGSITHGYRLHHTR